MFRFRVASIPVNVHLSHVLICGFLAWTFLGWKVSGWPNDVLSVPQHPLHGRTVVLVTATWTFFLSLSMLVHELGHALALRVFGHKAEVQLVGLGGRPLPGQADGLEWWQELLMLLAGPGATLALAIAAGLVALIATPEPLRYFARGLFFGNLTWTVLNLLPVTGLDGGGLSTVVLSRLFGRPGFMLAQGLAVAFAGLLLVWALLSGQPLLAVLVVFMVARTLVMVLAFQRGELQRLAPHPLNEVIERAEALYREKKLQEARVIALGVLEAAQTPALLRSRAHVLLGWIALKEGNGRQALDHFSQVQGLEVPLHALAAGFSLVGDELRAIPLWARASQAMPNDVLLKHEWAGALIRGGHEATARQIPGLELKRAFSAAERVLYVRKDFEHAARVAEDGFKAVPDPELAYTAACDWARAGKIEEAMRLLTLASQSGYRDADGAETDPDLRDLRHRPEFAAWLNGLKTPS
ncbi:MAG: peptidase M50 [Myxococcaceae bacterium]